MTEQDRDMLITEMGACLREGQQVLLRKNKGGNLLGNQAGGLVGCETDGRSNGRRSVTGRQSKGKTKRYYNTCPSFSTKVNRRFDFLCLIFIHWFPKYLVVSTC